MVPLVGPHNPRWKDAFAEEAKAIRNRLGDTHVDVHHIGSTAIPDILAKPIIDLLGVVANLAEIDAKTDAAETLEYEAMWADGFEGRRFF